MLLIYLSPPLLVVLGFEVHARQALYCLSCTSSPFCAGYFGGRVSLSAQASLDH
jgi:hypothetical protein